MKTWLHETLVHSVGRHIHSGPGARIQVLQPPNTLPRLWRIPKGELIIIALRGPIGVHTEAGVTILEESCHALLAAGESFDLCQLRPDGTSVVELIWMPGISQAPG